MGYLLLGQGVTDRPDSSRVRRTKEHSTCVTGYGVLVKFDTLSIGLSKRKNGKTANIREHHLQLTMGSNQF